MKEEHDIWLEEVKNCRRLKKTDLKNMGNHGGAITIRKNPNLDMDTMSYSANFPDEGDDSSYVLEKNGGLGIDRGTDRKLKGGRIRIDMRIDFHGMSLDRALDSLIHSITYAYEHGFRCILVVTGKGHNTKLDGISIKSQMGKWLRIPTLSSKIIKYVDAIPRHGGTGALYILLKKNRELQQNSI
jgi:DNA-nicking Smr family endonuclease